MIYKKKPEYLNYFKLFRVPIYAAIKYKLILKSIIENILKISKITITIREEKQN